ncbi:signal peptidase I [Candidatus Pacearchaeota archaeon]|nr:signal peptidase I [Candidatus Pacearchaeota archaeon]
MTGEKKKSHSKIAAEVANTFEWLTIAFILAFMFRAFIMEAYRIPTGSMASTLMGAHFNVRCVQCGYKYQYGFIPSQHQLPADSLPSGYIKPRPSKCPSCGFYQATGGNMSVSNGDRILVLKCLYPFQEPKRWDVVVFKNPLDPSINYIKRLVAKPGETVEIIDGDIYINGDIARKSPKAQKELWMPIYDNDYIPARPTQGNFNGHFWQQPFDIRNSDWSIEPDLPTKFHLDCPPGKVSYLKYVNTIGNDFKVTYAYNDIREFPYMPYCSDLLVSFYVNTEKDSGSAGAQLTKYQTTYNARYDFNGKMIIDAQKDGEIVELTSMSTEPIKSNTSVALSFAIVDHQLIFQVGEEKLKYDLGTKPDDAGKRVTNIPPQLSIGGAGKMTVSHVAVFRDIYYTAKKFPNSEKGGRAIEGNPLTLKDDQFFVLGDNSPNSEDGRWWTRPGIANNNKQYDKGIVPRDYLVGKAMFVYWPGGFKPFAGFPFAIIPNVGRVRFIYGGSEKTL